MSSIKICDTTVHNIMFYTYLCVIIKCDIIFENRWFHINRHVDQIQHHHNHHRRLVYGHSPAPNVATITLHSLNPINLPQLQGHFSYLLYLFIYYYNDCISIVVNYLSYARLYCVYAYNV